MEIQIRVRLFATLRRYQPANVNLAPERGFQLTLEDGTRLGDLVETNLEIPRQTVKTMFVNGVIRDDDYVLQDGDEVGIFPPIAGGVNGVNG